MVVEFHFAFELVGSFGYPLGFVIEKYYIRLVDVLFALFISCIWFEKIWSIERIWLIDVPVFVLMICVKSLILIKKIPHLLSNVVDF